MSRLNVFELIKTVLDEIYQRIPDEEAKKDEDIKKELNALSLAYSKLAQGGATQLCR